jgi:hypothetical protein
MPNEGQTYAQPAGFARLPTAIVEPRIGGNREGSITISALKKKTKSRAL